MENTGYYGATSQFDMGLAMLFRIHEVLNIVSEARITKDFVLWRDGLMAISGEVEDTFTKEQEQEYLKLLEEVNPLVAKSIPKRVFGRETPITQLNEEQFNDLYMKMRELDKFVRRMLNVRNMLLKKARDVRRASARME